MTKQEKLDLLSSDFRKLDENLKDYILELSRKLADIHCGVFPGDHNGNDREIRATLQGYNPA